MYDSISDFFLKWELFRQKVVEKKSTFYFQYPPPPKILPFIDDVEEYFRARDASYLACWIPKATNTRSEYEIIFAIPLQQWSRECASI
jgi:hypothetical protein